MEKTYKRKTYTGLINKLEKNQIFVFGSNPQGIHGAGAAKIACEAFGAVFGQGYGLQGQSWGLITKDLTKSEHPSIVHEDIENQLKVLAFVAYHTANFEYLIAYSGTGVNLNGYTNREMAAMFAKVWWPPNVIFEHQFLNLINSVKSEQG